MAATGLPIPRVGIVNFYDGKRNAMKTIIVRYGDSYSIEIPVNTDGQPITHLRQGDYATTMYISFDRRCCGIAGPLLKELLEHFDHDYDALGKFLYERQQYLRSHLEKEFHCIVSSGICCHKCCGAIGHEQDSVRLIPDLFAARQLKACRS